MDTMVSDGALFDGGPTMRQLTAEHGSWVVPDEALARYCELASEVTWRDLSEAAAATATGNSAVWSLRNAARLACGAQVVMGQLPLDQGWPSDVPKAQLPAYYVHEQLVTRAVRDVQDEDRRAQYRAATAHHYVCASCSTELTGGHVVNHLGLCNPCDDALRLVKWQRAAEQRVGKVTRAQLVGRWLDSQAG